MKLVIGTGCRGSSSRAKGSGTARASSSGWAAPRAVGGRAKSRVRRDAKLGQMQAVEPLRPELDPFAEPAAVFRGFNLDLANDSFQSNDAAERVRSWDGDLRGPTESERCARAEACVVAHPILGTCLDDSTASAAPLCKATSNAIHPKALKGLGVNT
jgi:hypothetical protein